VSAVNGVEVVEVDTDRPLIPLVLETRAEGPAKLKCLKQSKLQCLLELARLSAPVVIRVAGVVRRASES